MTNNTISNFRNFDVESSEVHLWAFKSSRGAGKFTAKYIRTDETLDESLKQFIRDEQERISEYLPYNYLAQPSENGCLTIKEEETDFQTLKNAIDRPETENSASKINELRGATGYVVKLVNDENTLYALRRSPTTWKTNYPKKGIVNTIFRNGELYAIENVDFTIQPGFDLFFIQDEIVISSKQGFESVLRYRVGYIAAFSQLQQQPEFSGLFTDMAPLISYVGKNGTHLRRMAVIQDKALYTNPGYLSALKEVCEKYSWGIDFDENGLIAPNEETASIIMRLLLDQRLVSEITKIMYDVPDATPVS